RILSLTQQAESSGFSYAWIFDSHVLWKEPFPLLTLMAANTRRMHLGTCVTNPAVRDVTVSASLFATLNLASHGRMELGIGRVDRGCGTEAARDFRKIEVMAAAPVWASNDLKTAREHVRWFPALVSNHVMDLISKYKPEELPPALTSYVKDRGKYDYLHHCEVGSDNADFVSDEVVDRFCVLGSSDDHREKLDRLRKAGVTQFNIYLMSGDEEQTLDAYKHEILPHYRR